jgi:voltage-gated potassium channel Kch
MAATPLRRRLHYWFDNTMSKGTAAMVGWLAVASLTVVVAGGILMWLMDPTPADGHRRHLLAALWQGVVHALDPGTVAADTGHWWYIGIAFAITVGGILVVSAFIGVLTTGLDAKLADLRRGRSAVLERDHTVLLGWSDQVFTIIQELVEANSSRRRRCIVILADRDKVEMEDEIRAKVGNSQNTRVVCRSGDPIDPDDINLVNPQGARSVIILDSPTSDHDAHLVKTLLAVRKSREGQATACRIVGSVADPKNLSAAQLAGGSEAHLIDAVDVTARLIVQTCLQSGLSTVFTDLLDFRGDEIYFHREEALVGSTYGQALHAFGTSSVIGVAAPDGEIVLNPAADRRIQPGDRLIAISADDDTIVTSDVAPIASHAITVTPDPIRTPRRTLVLGWNHRAPGVLRELDRYVAPGSEVYVIARHADAERQVIASSGTRANVVVDFKGEDSSDRAVLDSLGVEDFDHVIVLCADDVDGQLADSRTLVTLLHLRDIREGSANRFSIVSEMADDRNRVLAQVTEADDFVVSVKLLSLLTTQVSEAPDLLGVFASLFDAAGSEIYLKDAERFVRVGEAINFQTVVQAARLRGESAIGYRVAARAGEAPAYGVVLNPDKAASLTLRNGDRVIVLAEN